MALCRPKGTGTHVLRLIVGLALLGWPRVSSAQGRWSVISLPQKPGDVISPKALAVDSGGRLYVADMAYFGTGRIQKRDAQGNWSILATAGDAPGQVDFPTGLAVDTGGNLYIVERGYRGETGTNGRIQKRDTLGNWWVLARGEDIGESIDSFGLAVDTAGNLYIEEGSQGRFWVEKRNAQGNWSVFATPSGDRVHPPIAVDTADNLYVTHYDSKGSAQIEKRDAQGNWTVIATAGQDLGLVNRPTALAVDAAGNLYLAEYAPSTNSSRILERDARGDWSVIATDGTALGQVSDPSGLAVDGAGNLYVADTGNNRVLIYTPDP